MILRNVTSTIVTVERIDADGSGHPRPLTLQPGASATLYDEAVSTSFEIARLISDGKLIQTGSSQPANPPTLVPSAPPALGSTNGAIQFNSSGALGGDASNLFWDNTNKALAVGTASVLPSTVKLQVSGDSSVTGFYRVGGLQIASSNLSDSAFIVKKDVFGNFSANVITASLTGASSLNLLRSGDTLGGALNAGGFAINNLPAPVAPGDVATKAYTDAVAIGLDVKQHARAGSTGVNLALTGIVVIDGVVLAAGDRVLIKDQTIASQNGIYSVSAGAWARTPDASSTATVSEGMFVFVAEGPINAGGGWVLTTPSPITVGTTSLAFAQFSGAGEILAGVGIVKTGNTLSVNVGTGASQVVELNASAQLPVLDGSLLSALNASNLSVGTVPLARLSGITNVQMSAAAAIANTQLANSSVTITPGAGLTGGGAVSLGAALSLAVNVGTAANQVVQLNATAGLPAVNGSLLTNVSAAALSGIAAPAVAPTAGQALFASSATALSYGSLPVAGGGTGAVTLPLNSLVVGAGTAAVASIAPGAVGQVLTSNGTVWAAQALPAQTSPAPFYASAIAPLALINQFAWNSGLQASNALAAWPQPRAGSVTALAVAMSAATAVGSSTTFTLFKNGVATLLTVTIGAAISAVQTAVGGPVAFAANDLLSLNVTTTSTGPAVTFFPSLIVA